MTKDELKTKLAEIQARVREHSFNWIPSAQANSVEINKCFEDRAFLLQTIAELVEEKAAPNFEAIARELTNAVVGPILYSYAKSESEIAALMQPILRKHFNAARGKEKV